MEKYVKNLYCFLLLLNPLGGGTRGGWFGRPSVCTSTATARTVSAFISTIRTTCSMGDRHFTHRAPPTDLLPAMCRAQASQKPP